MRSGVGGGGVTYLLPRPGRVLRRVQGLDLALYHRRLQALVQILEAVHLQGVLSEHLGVFKLFTCGGARAQQS